MIKYEIDKDGKVMAADAGEAIHRMIEELQADFIRHTDKYPKRISITREMGFFLEAYFKSRAFQGPNSNPRDEKHTYFGAELVWDAPRFVIE